MSKYEILKVEDTEIVFDVTQLVKEESVMINATQIALTICKINQRIKN